jgi:hypothetical protein
MLQLIDQVLPFIGAFILVIGGGTVVVGTVLILVTARKREVSCRTVSAGLMGIWGTMMVAQALGGWTDSFVWSDPIAVLGASLWVVNAMWKHRGRVVTRATEFGALEGREDLTVHADLGKQ